MIEERSLELAGRRLAWREDGDPANSPVILLHAMGPDGGDWDAVSERLAARHRVIAIHQRGFGRGPRTAEYSFELMRDDVLALADSLGLERFSLVGHSMGGSVAFLVTEAEPARVSRLVIEDTPPPWGSDMPEPSPEAPPDIPFDWEAWRAIARQLITPDPRWWSELPRVTCPALLVGGGPSSPVPQELLARAGAMMPNALLATVEGAGHLVHATKLPEFLALVEPFLALESA
jgi:pimeloyl-ACP methyl ester carboxylesterase